MFPKFNQRQFENIVNVDKTQIHYSEPVRTIGNKIFLSKDGRRPVIAKRSINTNGVLYCISFHVVVQPQKLRSQSAKVLQVVITEILYQKSSRGFMLKDVFWSRFRHVCLLHDNAPSHIFELVEQFLESNNVTFCHNQQTPQIQPRVTFPYFKTQKVLIWSLLKVATSQ